MLLQDALHGALLRKAQPHGRAPGSAGGEVLALSQQAGIADPALEYAVDLRLLRLGAYSGPK